VDLGFSPEDEAFRSEAAAWLGEQLAGDFAVVRGRGGPGDEHALFDERLVWEQHLGVHGWSCVGWPREHGGRGLSLTQEVIFHEEYARAGGPGRVGHIGETLLGPTLVAFGTPEQQQRFLPRIVAATELWCQGYSEPDAGSDLANVKTTAVLDGDEWVLDGQKVWTSHAHWANWCFVIARTDRDQPRHKGVSYLLVPMDQPGVEVRPIRQISGTSEFNEVFFSGARTAAVNVVGEVNGGWRVAMGTLAFERGASTLGQQLAFQNELDAVVATARRTGRIEDPSLHARLVDAWIGLRIMRWNTLRVLSGADRAELGREAMITKLYWARWHRALGELAMDALGAEADLADQVSAHGDKATYELTALQRLFLFTRSDTIYAGSNQIQRNIIGERALGLPPEPKVV
jgi:acyl-CoA dehydrogenase